MHAVTFSILKPDRDDEVEWGKMAVDVVVGGDESGDGGVVED